MPPSDGPPPSNPVLSGYSSFVQSTPLVTRYVITTVMLTWVTSFLFDPTFAIANIPYFTIYKFEVYRLLTSPLICTSIFNLIFAYLGFVEHGKRLEFSIGSSSFAVLIGTLGLCTNVIFCALMMMLYIASGNVEYLHKSSASIWIILLALIAVECSQAPMGSKRRLLAFEIPAIYYPLVILGAFTLLGGFQLPYVISVGLGYVYGKGYMDRFKVSSSRVSGWESNNGCLSNFTQRPGWVVGHSATGNGAWAPINAEQSGSGGSSWRPSSFFQGAATRPDSSSSGNGASGGNASGSGTQSSPPNGGWNAPGETKKPTFPKAGGQTLGGGGGGGGGASVRTSGRAQPDARTAMLAAAERRNASDASSSGENNV